MKEESEKKMDVSLRIEALLLLLLYEKILLLFELLYVLVLLYVWLLFDFLTLKLLLRCLEGGDNEGDFDKILPMLLL